MNLSSKLLRICTGVQAAAIIAISMPVSTSYAAAPDPNWHVVKTQYKTDLNRLFKNGDNMFTHTWGMKQQMRDNAFLRADFCRRCIKRIIKDYPEMKNIIMNIENLKQYF